MARNENMLITTWTATTGAEKIEEINSKRERSQSNRPTYEAFDRMSIIASSLLSISLDKCTSQKMLHMIEQFSSFVFLSVSLSLFSGNMHILFVILFGKEHLPTNHLTSHRENTIPLWCETPDFYSLHFHFLAWPFIFWIESNISCTEKNTMSRLCLQIFSLYLFWSELTRWLK